MVFLHDMRTSGLIEVLDMKHVFDPFMAVVHGRTQADADTMDEDDFDKTSLICPSSESLPVRQPFP